MLTKINNICMKDCTNYPCLTFRNSLKNKPVHSKVKSVFTFGFQHSFLLPCFNWVMVCGLAACFITNCSVSYKFLNSLGRFDAV